MSQLIPSCRRIPLTEACSRRSCRIAQARARVVNFARGAVTRSSCSVNEPTGQDGSGHRQRRLTQMTRTGDPNAGASTSRTSRRPCPWAITPQVWQPIGAGGDSTRTVSPPSSSRATAVTLSPGKPTRRSQRVQQVPAARQHDVGSATSRTSTDSRSPESCTDPAVAANFSSPHSGRHDK